MTVKCERCGTDLQRRDRDVSAHHYCKPSCSAILNCLCKVCDRRFYRRPAYLAKKPGDFCSSKCYGISRRIPEVEKIAQIKDAKRRWKARNPNAWRATPEQRRQATARYFAKDPAKYRLERLAIAHRRRARKRAVGGTFTRVDILDLYKRQGGRCVYCSVDLQHRYEVDHIIPVARGGSNWPSNLQLLCRPCNRSKSHKLPDRFAAELRIGGNR